MRWIREFTLKERKKTAELTELFGLKTVSPRVLAILYILSS